ncbi:9-O-acetylesterase [Niabella ginsenosidivorans]|uniref:9-O-acetylesterase n=2 Tax=Niabella ginsenosidivorans TaxID=1176587 RepID=A0A1A9I7T8_9BACT|nr:9-O-acetylesterase [Niabella ginsenosidivorans]
MPYRKLFYLLLSAVIPVLSLNAAVKLPSVFSNNMVLQQRTDAAVWGTAAAGKTVTVQTSWDKRTYQAKADVDGNWKIKVHTPSFGGPYTVLISEENIITLNNVLIGDVWLCSGQSNMEMPLAGWGKIMNYQQEIANANYPDIRLLQAIHVTSNIPKTDLEVRNNGWDVCTPKTVAEFSAVAYFFARAVYEKTKIPIGLIHSSWGGTIAEAWTSYETLQTLPDFAAAAQKIKTAPETDKAGYEAQMKKWEQEKYKADKGFENGAAVWAKPGLDISGWKTMRVPGLWEGKGYPDLDGVAWFRKKITVPDSWAGKDLTLSLSTIDDDDIAFFNGVQVGATVGYNQDRRYTVPAKLVNKGDNYIAVRVADNGGGGGMYGNVKEMFLRTADGQQIDLSGDWLFKIAFSFKDIPPAPQNPQNPNRPTVLYNAMIHPVISFAIKGAIWYQGESNAGRAYQYRELFPAMIKDWRSRFQSGDFSFYFVQLANYMKRADEPSESSWAELREAQLMTTKLPNTGMATIIDIGNATDIHPKNKQEVGRRLALIALNKIYGRKNEYSGPLYRSQKISRDKIILIFDHAQGMTASGGSLKGFSIAGSDKKFYRADAEIKGNTVIVSSKNVKSPVAVRYAWADNPEASLINSAGLPASPFRTDSWEGITKGVK